MKATTRPRGRTWLSALVAASVLACGGDDDPPDDPTTTSSPPTSSTTPTTQDPEAEVEAAYLAYWDMAVRLAEAPNPDDPEIAQRAIDPVRGTLIDSLSTLRASGRIVRAGEQLGHSVREVRIGPGEAVVRDCAIDDSAVVDMASGEVVEESVVTTLMEATLAEHDGTWLVQEINQLDSWNGAVPCDV